MCRGSGRGYVRGVRKRVFAKGQGEGMCKGEGEGICKGSAEGYVKNGVRKGM